MLFLKIVPLFLFKFRICNDFIAWMICSVNIDEMQAVFLNKIRSVYTDTVSLFSNGLLRRIEKQSYFSCPLCYCFCYPENYLLTPQCFSRKIRLIFSPFIKPFLCDIWSLWHLHVQCPEIDDKDLQGNIYSCKMVANKVMFDMTYCCIHWIINGLFERAVCVSLLMYDIYFYADTDSLWC